MEEIEDDRKLRLIRELRDKNDYDDTNKGEDRKEEKKIVYDSSSESYYDDSQNYSFNSSTH